MEQSTLETRLLSGELDGELTTLYGAERLEDARSRCAAVLSGFAKTFACLPEALFSAPGRTELGGNHTDHQHGRVLAAAVNLDILAAAAPNQSGMIRVQSEGYPLIVVDLKELTPKQGEENTSAALIRGVAARMAALGCPLQDAGLDAYIVSNVPGGSGLSSSAAFEVLIGTMLNALFWNGKSSAVEIAQIGQYAENVFFGKPCGLMDQTASAVGGMVTIDFFEKDHPVIESVDFDFASCGHALCIIDSRASHADLTDEYAAITQELKAVCAHFGKDVLTQIDPADFYAAIPALRESCGDRAVLRAMHFYNENARVPQQVAALQAGDFAAFLELVKASGASSYMYLQNVIPAGYKEHQEVAVTIAAAKHFLNGAGAVRVHGGGFAGTVQAFVPLEKLDAFKAEMEAILGAGKCHILSIRPEGGAVL